MLRVLKRNRNIVRKTIVKYSKYLLLLFFVGCSSPTDPYEVEVEIQHNLSIVNGVPTLTLSDTWQTIHMLDFRVTLNGQPYEYAHMRFWSDLYWALNDTFGYFIHQGLSDDVVYVTYDTTYVTGGGLHDLVPTSNHSSMTDDDGQTRNAIAPIRTMAGSTLTLNWDVWVDEAMEEKSGIIIINLE